MYRFRNPDGTLLEFGPGAHLRTWKRDFGKAHDVWVAQDEKCFHSPGLGDAFREDYLPSVLSDVRWLSVVNYATTYEEFCTQLARARAIVGLPWTLSASNCQHTVSWVTTGKATSFQWESLLALGLVVLLPVALSALNAQQPPLRHRTRARVPRAGR